MTVNLPDQESRNEYLGNGTLTIFNYTYKLLLAEDVSVWVTEPDEQVPDKKVLNVDYTVQNVGTTSGGTITFTTAPVNNAQIVIQRTMTYSQDTSFSDAKTFSGQNLDEAIERVTMLAQQNNTIQSQQGLRYADGEYIPGSGETILPVLKENRQIWMFNGTAVQAVTLEENPNEGTLRSELSNQAHNTDGSRLVGYYDTVTTSGKTVHDMLAAMNAEIQTLKADLSTAAFTTGDEKLSSKTTADTGWLLQGSGTIGNPSSNATALADDTAEALFKFYWNHANSARLPLYDSSGQPVARGASADADYTANKAISLPFCAGQSPMASQNGLSSSYFGTFTADVATETLTVTVGGETDPTAAMFPAGCFVQLKSTGTLPSGLSPSTNYWITVVSGTEIKLSTTSANAVAETYVSFTDVGAGTHSIHLFNFSTAVLSNGGFFQTLQFASNMVNHTHNLSDSSDLILDKPGGLELQTDPGSENYYKAQSVVIQPTGGSLPMPTLSPYYARNVFVKL